MAPTSSRDARDARTLAKLKRSDKKRKHQNSYEFEEPLSSGKLPLSDVYVNPANRLRSDEEEDEALLNAQFGLTPPPNQAPPGVMEDEYEEDDDGTVNFDMIRNILSQAAGTPSKRAAQKESEKWKERAAEEDNFKSPSPIASHNGSSTRILHESINLADHTNNTTISEQSESSNISADKRARHKYKKKEPEKRSSLKRPSNIGIASTRGQAPAMQKGDPYEVQLSPQAERRKPPPSQRSAIAVIKERRERIKKDDAVAPALAPILEPPTKPAPREKKGKTAQAPAETLRAPLPPPAHSSRAGAKKTSVVSTASVQTRRSTRGDAVKFTPDILGRTTKRSRGNEEAPRVVEPEPIQQQQQQQQRRKQGDEVEKHRKPVSETQGRKLCKTPEPQTRPNSRLQKDGGALRPGQKPEYFQQERAPANGRLCAECEATSTNVWSSNLFGEGMDGRMFCRDCYAKDYKMKQTIESTIGTPVKSIEVRSEHSSPVVDRSVQRRGRGVQVPATQSSQARSRGGQAPLSDGAEAVPDFLAIVSSPIPETPRMNGRSKDVVASLSPVKFRRNSRKHFKTLPQSDNPASDVVEHDAQLPDADTDAPMEEERHEEEEPRAAIPAGKPKSPKTFMVDVLRNILIEKKKLRKPKPTPKKQESAMEAEEPSQMPAGKQTVSVEIPALSASQAEQYQRPQLRMSQDELAALGEDEDEHAIPPTQPEEEDALLIQFGDDVGEADEYVEALSSESTKNEDEEMPRASAGTEQNGTAEGISSILMDPSPKKLPSQQFSLPSERLSWLNRPRGNTYSHRDQHVWAQKTRGNGHRGGAYETTQSDEENVIFEDGEAESDRSQSLDAGKDKEAERRGRDKGKQRAVSPDLDDPNSTTANDQQRHNPFTEKRFDLTKGFSSASEIFLGNMVNDANVVELLRLIKNLNGSGENHQTKEAEEIYKLRNAIVEEYKAMRDYHDGTAGLEDDDIDEEFVGELYVNICGRTDQLEEKAMQLVDDHLKLDRPNLTARAQKKQDNRRQEVLSELYLHVLPDILLILKAAIECYCKDNVPGIRSLGAIRRLMQIGLGLLGTATNDDNKDARPGMGKSNVLDYQYSKWRTLFQVMRRAMNLIRAVFNESKQHEIAVQKYARKAQALEQAKIQRTRHIRLPTAEFQGEAARKKVERDRVTERYDERSRNATEAAVRRQDEEEMMGKEWAKKYSKGLTAAMERPETIEAWAVAAKKMPEFLEKVPAKSKPLVEKCMRRKWPHLYGEALPVPQLSSQVANQRNYGNDTEYVGHRARATGVVASQRPIVRAAAQPIPQQSVKQGTKRRRDEVDGDPFAESAEAIHQRARKLARSQLFTNQRTSSQIQYPELPVQYDDDFDVVYSVPPSTAPVPSSTRPRPPPQASQPAATRPRSGYEPSITQRRLNEEQRIKAIDDKIADEEAAAKVKIEKLKKVREEAERKKRELEEQERMAHPDDYDDALEDDDAILFQDNDEAPMLVDNGKEGVDDGVVEEKFDEEEDEVTEGDIAGNVHRVRMFGSRDHSPVVIKPWSADELMVLYQCMVSNSKPSHPLSPEGFLRGLPRFQTNSRIGKDRYTQAAKKLECSYDEVFRQAIDSKAHWTRTMLSDPRNNAKLLPAWLRSIGEVVSCETFGEL